jgi:hypothetical protein
MARRGWGSITRRRRGKGKPLLPGWWVRYREGGQRKWKYGGATVAEAERTLEETRVRVLGGVPEDPDEPEDPDNPDNPPSSPPTPPPPPSAPTPPAPPLRRNRGPILTADTERTVPRGCVVN